MIGRLKFEFGDLVNQILDQLPEEIFQSETTKFLDPAIGGGQFVKEIEERLRKRGHSDENISKRVFGFESNILAIRYAKNRHGLVGQYFSVSCDNLFVKNDKYIYNNDIRRIMEMKFDVIVGNPPYNADNKAKRKPWFGFVLNAIRSGASTVMFVTPSSWAYGEKREVTEVRNTLKRGLCWADLSASRFFPDVSEDISVWSWQKDFCGKTVVTTRKGEIVEHNFETRFIEDDNKIFLNIEKKVMFNNEKLELKFCNFEKSALSKIQSSNFQYSIQYSASQILFSHNVPEHYFLPKVFINRSGHYWTAKTPEKYVRYMPEGVAGSLARYVIVNNEIEAKNLVKILHSKLFILLIQMNPTKNIQFKDDIQRLPKMDIQRTWTDDELYQYFGLTKEEIAYVELMIESANKTKMGKKVK